MKGSHRPQGFTPRRRLTKLDFAGTEYAGLEVTITTSFPMGILDELESGDPKRVWPALCDIIVDWNLCDMRTGKPLGPPDEQALKRAPADLIGAVLVRALETVKGGGLDPNAERPSGDS